MGKRRELDLVWRNTSDEVMKQGNPLNCCKQYGCAQQFRSDIWQDLFIVAAVWPRCHEG